MEANENGLKEYVAVLRRRKKLILGTFLSLLVLSTIAAFLWPPTYRSTAVILIRDQEIPRDLVPSTITSFADQRLMEIQARVVTSSNLARLIEDFDLYKDLRRRLPTTEVVEVMRNDYQLDLISADVIDPRTGRPTQSTILFTVSFDYETAATAQQVTNRLVDLYLNENLRDRTERAQETTSFLSEQADKLEREISQLEDSLARFKERSGGALPELYNINLQMMERSESDLRELQRQKQALLQQQIYLESQLAQLSPTATINASDGSMLPADAQLAALQTTYATLSATYGPNHPDVASVRRRIEALKGEVGEVTDVDGLETNLQVVYSNLTEQKERYGPSHPDVIRLERQYVRLKAERDAALDAQSRPSGSAGAAEGAVPSNPVYVTLAAQLDAVQSSLRSMGTREAQLQAKMADYEQRIFVSPQVEREYAGLARDLGNARMKYQEIRAKELAAEVSESLEQGRKGERFEVVEPAMLPTLPHTPNRLALLFLGLVLSVAGSVGTTALSESMDNAIHNPQALAMVLGHAPIAAIPFIANEFDTKRDRRTIWMIVAGIAFAILVSVLLVHFLYKPVDVIWYVLLRKLGI